MTLRVTTDEIVAADTTGTLAIHPSWARVRLREIADVQNGFPFRSGAFSHERGIPLLRIRDVGVNRPDTYIDGEVDPSYVVNQDDIVIGMDGDFRAARWLGPPAALNQRVCRVTPTTNLCDSRFLLHALQPYLDAVNRATSAVTVKHLSSTTLLDLPLPLPPLAEQERIVDAIEEAFSKLDAGETGLRAVRQLLKRMRDSVLTAAVTGRLVPQDPTDTPATKLLAEAGIESELPDGRSLPDGWVAVRIADIATVGSGTTPKRTRSEYWTDGRVPWVASGALNVGVVTEPTAYVTDVALEETSLRLWPIGTLLVAMYGEGQTRGRCAELAIEASCNQACAAIALRHELELYRPVLRLHFDANYSSHRRLASGGVQPNLSGALIKDMVVTLPPPEEATRAIAEAERRFSFIEACEVAVDAELTRTGVLRRSVLKAAFEGRLVPQDPSDEPASMLVERIRATRAKVSSNGGTRRQDAEDRR